MKNLIVRLSVLALATTGFTASTLTTQALAKNTVKPASVSMGSSLPGCAWNHPCIP